MTVRDAITIVIALVGFAICYWLGYIAGKEINTRRDDGPSGRSWGTYWRMPNGSLRRLRSLPIRATREEAEHDLAAYAAAKGLVRVESPWEGEEK